MIKRRISSEKRTIRLLLGWALISLVMLNGHYFSKDGHSNTPVKNLIMFANGHVVLTRDDTGQSLVLTGEDGGKGGKGGKGGGGDRLVITGNNMGGGTQNSNTVMDDATEGDVVINGNSMIIPGEDGHIVLADGRNRQQEGRGPPPPNPFAFWMPYMSNRMGYRMMPFFNGQFG